MSSRFGVAGLDPLLRVGTAVQLVLASVVIVLADVIFFDREFVEAGDASIDHHEKWGRTDIFADKY